MSAPFPSHKCWDIFTDRTVLAFVCLLLCTVSTPIVKGIWLFQVSAKATNLDARVSFGVFGGCGTTANFRFVFLGTLMMISLLTAC